MFKRKPAPAKITQWPVVTIQLPLYNEQQVAGRLIDAIASLDYPNDKLMIQVLDDSTDETCELVDEKVENWRKQGRWIVVQRRSDRSDYKAGALKAGMESAAGDYIAIFDADFIPPVNWLKRAIIPFLQPGSDKLGLVQTRWGHLNDDYSLLTGAQALALDGHFGIDQVARCRAGFFFNSNGTAGIWKRKCIEDSGNWSGGTLTEDLDLSYRAQLRGWKIFFLEDVVAPAELPTLMVGFKRQQFRWSKGSIQVAKQLLPKIIRARISLPRKLESIVHLTGYTSHLFMVVMLLLALPLTLWGDNVFTSQPMRWLGMIGTGLPFYYITAQLTLYDGKNFWRWFYRMPVLSMVGVGIAVSNTKAVLEGLMGKDSAFERTPKTGAIKRVKSQTSTIKEQFKVDNCIYYEIFFGFYAMLTAILTLQQANWIGGLFFSLYSIGFLWVAGASLYEARMSRDQVGGDKSLATE